MVPRPNLQQRITQPLIDEKIALNKPNSDEPKAEGGYFKALCLLHFNAFPGTSTRVGMRQTLLLHHAEKSMARYRLGKLSVLTGS